MTYINLSSTSSVLNVKSTFSIFSLMIRNPASSSTIQSTGNLNSGLYHDSLHMVYSNNIVQLNCPSFSYKPYVANSAQINYSTYNSFYTGQFSPSTSVGPANVFVIGDAAAPNIRFFNPSGSTTANPHFSCLRFYTGSSTNDPIYSIGNNNLYRPDVSTCIIPKIRLKGGFEYYIEVINNTNRIKFSTETAGLQQISLKKEASPDIDSDMSKIYINNDSYNPQLYASYVNKNTNQYDIFSLTYKFDDYNSLGSQWASRFIIHQIPIV